NPPGVSGEGAIWRMLRKRKGFGWERRSRLTRGCLRLSGETRQAESRPSRIGPISLGMKQMGARTAGNLHAACDVEGAGNVAWSKCVGQTGAPVLDPTDERGRETGSPRRNPRSSSTLLCASLGRAQPEAGGLPVSGDP